MSKADRLSRTRLRRSHRKTLAAGCLLAVGAIVAYARTADACGGSGAWTLPVPTAIAAYWNNGNQTENVIYADPNAALWCLTHSSTGWSSTQLTTEGVYAPGSPILAYADSYGTGRVFFLVAAGNNGAMAINELRGNPPRTSVNITFQTGSTVYPQGFQFTGPDNCAAFVDSNGATLTNSVANPTNLVGFQDSKGTHHVFYLGWNNSPTAYPNIYELYDSSSGDNWTNHEIVGISEPALHVPVGLTALWDGSCEHVYWNQQPGVTNQAYYCTGWATNILNTPPNSYAPYYNMTAISPPNEQWIWGTGWSAANHQNSTWPGAQYYFSASSHSWLENTIGATNIGVNSGTTSFTWTDKSTGLDNTGVNGGFFYVAPNDYIYEYIPNTGDQQIAGPTSTQRQYSPITNQIAGMSDPGDYIHVFWVNDVGDVVEDYTYAGNLNMTFPSWTSHILATNGAH